MVKPNEITCWAYFRHIKGHYFHRLNTTPNWEYLSHPINSYHLVRHIATGWKHIFAEIFTRPRAWWREKVDSLIWNNVYDDVSTWFLILYDHYQRYDFNFMQYFLKSIDWIFQSLEHVEVWMKEELPGPKDLEGAAQGLSKLWTQYRYAFVG